MSEDVYHVPWQEFVASLTLLQIPIKVTWLRRSVGTRSGYIRLNFRFQDEPMVRSVLDGYKLWRVQRADAPAFIYFKIPVMRFSGIPAGPHSLTLNSER